MKATSKKFFFVLLSTLFVFSMLFPVSASADEPQSTLGTETPYMYCAFLDANGKQVDGNALTSGDYTVDIIVAEMAHASILQFTANYDSSVITDHEVTRTIADDANSNVSLGGIKDENDILVIALASEDSNYSALDAENGTSIATLEVTIDAGEDTVDFEDVFSFSNDPDLTFLEADYADGYDDAYVTDENAQTAYNTYLMIADASPEFLTVSATVVMATALDGESGVTGAPGINVYTDLSQTPVATTAADGTFTALVPRGTKKLILTNHSFENGVKVPGTGTTIDREVTLGGKQGVAYQGTIPVIVCDYNGDGNVNVADKILFSQSVGKVPGDDRYNPYCNLNGDNVINLADNVILSKYINKVKTNYQYQPKALDNNS